MQYVLQITNQQYDPDKPLLLFENGGHAVYWLGFASESVFRCNSYMIVDGDEYIVVDPGGINGLSIIEDHIRQICPLDSVTGLVISHQDPDIAGSIRDWTSIKPGIRVFSSPRTEVLLPYYGTDDYSFYDVEALPDYTLPSGHKLQFVPSYFLHSPMSIACFDSCSGFLFTSDVFAAIDSEWQLVVENFDDHIQKMNLFHLDYMASGVAARGFVENIDGLPITAFLPQHGSLIPKRFVEQAKDYLNKLQCGLDLLYPHL